MNKLFSSLIITLLVLSTAYSGESIGSSEDSSENDSITNNTVVDSLALALNRLDSIHSMGQLVHFDTWKIGNLKSIEVQV